MVERDERGFPVRDTRNPEGLCSVRLDSDSWRRLSELRAKWEGELAQPLTRTDVIIACIRQTHAREVGGQAGKEASPAGREEATARDSEHEEPCQSCLHTPAGNETKCMFCGRGLAADKPDQKAQSDKPHPEKLVRKKRRA